jgi:uncharacterized integral membrane protein
MKQIKVAGSSIIAALILIIILQNTSPVETRILFATFVMPRAALLFITAVLGFCCGVLVTMITRTKNKPRQ